MAARALRGVEGRGKGWATRLPQKLSHGARLMLRCANVPDRFVLLSSSSHSGRASNMLFCSIVPRDLHLAPLFTLFTVRG